MATNAHADRQLIAVPPAQLRDCWASIVPGLEAIRAKGGATWIAEDVYHAIRAGVSWLYLGHIDGKQVGFVVLTPQADYDGKNLLVWCCYADTDHDPVEAFSDDLKAIARGIGAKRLIFGSQRRWDRRLADYGWKPLTTYYGMDL